MANQSSMRDSHHMSLIKPMLSAECSEVSDRDDYASVGIYESRISLDVRALANAVPMCPPFVGFQLAFALSQSNHRRMIEVMYATELMRLEIVTFDSIRVNKAMPP